MIIRWLTLTAVLAFGLVARADEPFALNVLYAGNPGSDREKDFAALLGKHFARVGKTDYRTFEEADARGYDVVILDWTSIYPRDENGRVKEPLDRMNIPKPPELSEQYDRPTILIGAAGEKAARPLRLMIDWRCLCLDDAAHGMMLSHAVFNTPFKVNLEFEEVPTPENYLGFWGDDEKLGKTIKVWRVQTRKFPEVDPGLVSNPYGFEDSPDAEAISSGLNLKGPKSVALGRHANFFLWGFSAAPEDMTPEARKCFVNAVCYIRAFDGQKPVARKTGAGYTRNGAVAQANYLRTISNEEEFKRELPASLRDDAEKYARYRQSALKFAYENYPEEVRRRLGSNPEKYIEWVKENLEFLRFDGDGYDAKTVVDEDVKSLGLSNRKVELLVKCISMLEQGDRPELASRILKRYTTEEFPDARGWRAWLENGKSRLFFTEVGGFKWLVAPVSLMKVPVLNGLNTSDAGKLTEPDREHPVTASAELSPSRVRAGETATFVVRVQTAPTWHIYALTRSGGVGIPTSLKLKLPDGVEAEGDWDVATPTRSSDGQMTYEGEVEFRRKLRIVAGAETGAMRLTCEFGYQACDPHSCRPPARAELVAKAEVFGDKPER